MRDDVPAAWILSGHRGDDGDQHDAVQRVDCILAASCAAIHALWVLGGVVVGELWIQSV